MAKQHTMEFKQEAVRVALTSGELRPKFPPRFCRALGFELMALRSQFVH